MYVKVIDGVANVYSIGQLRSDNPNVSFPMQPSEELLASYNVYPLVESAQPTYNALTQKVVESSPTQVNGVWTQQWNVVDLTADEVNTLRQGMQVSMRQARLALLSQGLLTQIEETILALPANEYQQAQIEWEYGSTVERLSPWVVNITAALGMTDAEVDQLFVTASQF